MDFESYLKQQKLAKSTIQRYLSWEKEFILFFSIEKIKVLTYNDLLSYFKDKEQNQLKRSSLIHLLNRIQHYYNYLEIENPFVDFKLKGYEMPIKPQYLSIVQLKQMAIIYHQNKRLGLLSKIAIGLLIYQGLSTHELPLLTIKNIDLQAAEITVPSSHLNSRILALEASQILDLMLFTTDKKADESLLNYKSTYHLQNRHTHWKEQLQRELKKHQINIPFENLQQLRASRIAAWIKDHGILHAQYLAGHQHLSSTQNYQSQDYQQLRATFEQIHPLF